MKLLLSLCLPVLLLSADNSIRGFPTDAAATEKKWEDKLRAIPDAARVGRYIERMSNEPHMAGTPQSKAVADYLAGLLREWGLDARIEEFEALLPTPVSRRLEMVSPKPFRAKLNEPPVAGDKNSADSGQVPSFNAYSGSGDVTAPLVYVNYGVPDDYEVLKKLGIDVKGKVVIARYGGSWRGTKPKVAQEHGAVGCLIYSDPRDDGYFQGDVYPKGPYRPADGIQRGSVVDMALYPGDPLSPGFASEKGVKRLAVSEAKTLMKIPVMPISYADATPLLQNLDGPVAPEDWRGALNFTYHIGPGSTKVHFKVEMDNSTHPLYDVVVRIPGSEFPDEWILYGNHHDAWVHGASDPGSGAAALLETARSFSELVKQGWKPKRTIMLALWDGEEFGLMGSTEWAEKHAGELGAKLVAYINSDSNGKGRLGVGGSHTLEEFVSQLARDIPDPVSGKALIETPRTPRGGAASRRGDPTAPPPPDDGKYRIQALGSGSDYTSFLQHLGVATLNMGFGGEGGGGVYHSNYDDFYWYSHFSDTTFAYGRTLSEVTGTAMMRLADAPLLPFEFSRFASTVTGYVDEIERLEKQKGHPNLSELRTVLDSLRKTAASFDTAYARALPKTASASPARLSAINALLFRSERTMMLAGGLPGRDWFKHAIYAPGTYTGYGVKTLPGIREAVEGDRLDEATQQAEEVVKVLQNLNAQLVEAGRLLENL
jgi:N-acetylated-alpha-linked acidic dipeptidase